MILLVTRTSLYAKPLWSRIKNICSHISMEMHMKIQTHLGKTVLNGKISLCGLWKSNCQNLKFKLIPIWAVF